VYVYVRMLPTKMAVVVLLALVTTAGLVSGRQIHVHNRLGYTVWVGILGNPGKGQPDDGGFALNNGQRVSRGQDSCGCGTWSAKGRNCTEATGKTGFWGEYLDLCGRK